MKQADDAHGRRFRVSLFQRMLASDEERGSTGGGDVSISTGANSNRSVSNSVIGGNATKFHLRYTEPEPKGSTNGSIELTTSKPTIAGGDGAPPPVEVRISTRVLRIGQINNAQQTFYADLILVAEWDYREDLGVDWRPFVEVHNSLNVETVFEVAPRLMTGRGNTPQEKAANANIVRRTARYRGEFFQDLNLHRFPFDRQELTVKFRSALSSKKVIVRTHPDRPHNLAAFRMDEFEVLPMIMTCQLLSDPTQSSSNSSYGELHVRLYVERHSSYYLTNIVAILFLISSTAFVNFYYAVDDLPARMDLNLALLLTLIAEKWVISDTLPKISYLTKLDVYILGAVVLLFSIVLESVIISDFDIDLAQSVDHIFAYTCAGLWAAFHCWFFVWILFFGHSKISDFQDKEQLEKFEVQHARDRSWTGVPTVVDISADRIER